MCVCVCVKVQVKGISHAFIGVWVTTHSKQITRIITCLQLWLSEVKGAPAVQPAIILQRLRTRARMHGRWKAFLSRS